MRFLVVAAVAAAAMLGVAGSGWAQAQKVPPIKIEKVQVGFTTGGADSSGFKTGAWAPVYIELTAGLGRIGRADGSIFISTTDNDDLENNYQVDLPPLEPEEQGIVLGYVRTGTPGSEVRVSIRSARDGHELAGQKAPRASYAAAPSTAFLYLTAGSGSVGIRRVVHPPPIPGQEENAADFPDNDNTNVFAYARTARELPTRWFGYAGVDLLILNTSGPTFVKELLEDKSNRKEALAEWVRRGGRVVMSVGSNHQLVNALLAKMPIIPCTVTGTVQRPSLSQLASWVGPWQQKATPPLEGLPSKPGAREKNPVDIAKLDIPPNRGVEELVVEPEAPGDAVKRPVVIQAPYDLGRVILVATDVDLPPFTTWQGRTAFWSKINNEFRPGFTPTANGQPQPMMAPGMPGGPPGAIFDNVTNRADITPVLQERLENFKEVPVISFGWVALFILLYIVVVGPVDYLFLKFVVKRLELTWITFPAVVLVVSALAYGTAYYLKGDELRINKVDVVDIVAEPSAEGAAGESHATWASGTTWFTLFSPRIQNYTIGVEPSAGSGWVPNLAANADTPANPHSVVVSWMGRTDSNAAAGGSPSLFRRPYDYAPDAAGLQGVPIQVWSNKSFTATWEAELPAEQPLFQAEIRRARDNANADRLSGSITSHLPVELQDVVLFYRGSVDHLAPLTPGVPVRLDDLFAPGRAKPLSEWFERVYYQDNQMYPGYRPTSTLTTANGLIKLVLFSDANNGQVNNGPNQDPQNRTLRSLDETWRLKRTDGVVLFGRVAPLDQQAEAAMHDPANPTQLWLGKLPAPGEKAPSLPGHLSQETYVRIFLPVAPK